jgi:hypothetical protein
MTTLQLDLQVISERARTGRGVARFLQRRAEREVAITGR